MNYGKGLLLAFLTAIISGVSVFVNGAAVKLADPSVYAALKNIGALVFIGAIALAFTGLHHFRCSGGGLFRWLKDSADIHRPGQLAARLQVTQAAQRPKQN